MEPVWNATLRSDGRNRASNPRVGPVDREAVVRAPNPPRPRTPSAALRPFPERGGGDAYHAHFVNSKENGPAYPPLSDVGGGAAARAPRLAHVRAGRAVRRARLVERHLQSQRRREEPLFCRGNQISGAPRASTRPLSRPIAASALRWREPFQAQVCVTRLCY